jgi:hypothetical protein
MNTKGVPGLPADWLDHLTVLKVLLEQGIDGLAPESSGKFLSYDGSVMPW